MHCFVYCTASCTALCTDWVPYYSLQAYELSICSSTTIPDPARIQYPFEQLGSYVHSYEV